MNKLFQIITNTIILGVLCLTPLTNNFYDTLNFINVSAVASNGAYESVITQNIEKMNNINSYSSEFVVDYVSPSRDYNEVVDTLNRIQELSDTLCEGISDDYNKIRKLHDYVSSNVYYDHYASENEADFNTICLKNVLDLKRTICAGYSNLFSALCNAQGIYCVNIRGTSRSSEVPNISLEDAPTNHEWTAVWYESESRWVYVDCTWDSPNHYYSDDDIVSGNLRTTYFDISVEDISIDHKAKIVDYRNFFDAINYFEVPSDTQTTLPPNEVTSNTQTTTTNTTTTIDTSITTSINTIDTTNTTTETKYSTMETIATAENTSSSSHSLLPIILCMALSLMCTILLIVYNNK